MNKQHKNKITLIITHSRRQGIDCMLYYKSRLQKKKKAYDFMALMHQATEKAPFEDHHYF